MRLLPVLPPLYTMRERRFMSPSHAPSPSPNPQNPSSEPARDDYISTDPFYADRTLQTEKDIKDPHTRMFMNPTLSSKP